MTYAEIRRTADGAVLASIRAPTSRVAVDWLMDVAGTVVAGMGGTVYDQGGKRGWHVLNFGVEGYEGRLKKMTV